MMRRGEITAEEAKLAFSVRHVPQYSIACARFCSDVQLILVDQSMLDTLRGSLCILANCHPKATKVVMTTEKLDLADELIEINRFQRSQWHVDDFKI
jgi:hypothetical protein